MGNNGSGGCSVFIVLLLVFGVFGAGYLLAESNQQARQDQVNERALEMTGATIATLVPQATQAVELRAEVERVQSEASAAIAAQVKAENARIAAEEARKQADHALVQANAARAAAESDQAAAIAARQQAETNLAVAYQIYQGQQANIDQLEGQVAGLRGELAVSQRQPGIPVSGQVQTLTGKLVSDDSLLPMLGFALFGLVLGFVVTHMVSPARNGEKSERMPALKHDSRYTYVKMTREEARQYARQRGK